MENPLDDVDLARSLAQTAGQLLLEVRSSGLLQGHALGTAGDAVAQAFLARAVAFARPLDGVLSEELADNPTRLQLERTWIIDPLDGTREYSEGRSDWAVHVGLAVNGHAVVGAVALPGLGLVFDSAGPPRPLPAVTRPRMLVSRTRPSAASLAVAERLGADIIQMGSAGAKAMAVVRGKAEIYLHSGGQYEWDSCAPVAVAAAAGLHVSRVDGSTLFYNRENPYLPDILICKQDLAELVLKAYAVCSDII